MLRKIVVILILGLLCLSCKKAMQENEVVFIDLNLSQELEMSKLFESIDYLLVKEWDSLPIVQPYKVVFEGNLIFIEDNELDNIFIVDRTDGNIKQVLKSGGSGPREFNQIEDFQIRDDEVIIKDVVSGKFIIFDFQGNFLNEERFYNEATNFFIGGGFTIHYFNNRPTKEGYNFLTVNKDGSTYLADSINPIYGRSPTFNLDNGFQWDRVNQEIFLYHPAFYSLNFFDSSGRWAYAQYFDFGKYSLSDELRINYVNGAFLEDQENSENVYVRGISRFFSFEEFYFMTVLEGRKRTHHILLDKNFAPLIQIEGLENDLDGMSFRNIPRFSTDKDIVVMTRSNRLYNDYQRDKETLLERFPESKIHEFVNQISEKMYDDRVAFVFLKLKSKEEIMEE